MKPLAVFSPATWALLTFAFLGSASALEASDEAVVSEKFTDWELFCQPGGECRISQRLVVEDSGETVFLLTALRSDEGGPYVGIVSVR